MCVLALLIDALEPLGLDVRSLGRLGTTARALRDAVGACESAWAVAAAQMGQHDRTCHDDVEALVRRQLVFSADAFGASIERDGEALLELGSGVPITRRVAAVHSMVSIGRGVAVDLHVREVESGPPRPASGSFGSAVLWLGVCYDKERGAALDSATMDAALRGYDGARFQRGATSMSERFTGGGWSMNALGSSGAVWADGGVGRLLGPAFRFGAGSTVRLIIDVERRELRVSVDGGREALAVRRLLPRIGSSTVTRPALHVIAHLTDVAFPDARRRVRVRLAVGDWVEL